MSKVQLQGNASGTGIFTIASPNSNTDRTLTLPDNTGTLLSSASSITQNSGPAFGAYKSASSQSVTTGTMTKVTFDVEEFDTNNNFASSTFTPTVAGYYQLNANALWNGGTSSGVYLISLWKNGAEFKRGVQATAATNDSAATVSALIYCNGTTDYIDVYVLQNSGSNKTVANTQYQTWFNGALMRSA